MTRSLSSVGPELGGTWKRGRRGCKGGVGSLSGHEGTVSVFRGKEESMNTSCLYISVWKELLNSAFLDFGDRHKLTVKAWEEGGG